MTVVLKKGGNLDTETGIEGIQCEDIGRRWPSSNQRESLGIDPSFTALRRNKPCLHLNFTLLASRTVRQYISVKLILISFVKQP